MSKMIAIARRDVSAWFTSPVAYVVISAFAFIIAFFFANFLDYYQRTAQGILMQAMGSPDADQLMAQVNVVDLILVPMFSNASVVFLLLMPAVTMRLLAEEKRTGTDELLLTAPLTVNQIVIGKFLAGLVLILAIMAPTLVPIGCMFAFGNPPIKIVLSSYLGLLLLGACFLSVGLLASSLTENQIVAAVLAFAFLLTLFVIGMFGELAGDQSSAGRILKYLSLTNHFEDFTQGVISSVHVVYYLSLIFMGLFLTSRVVESRRWR